MNDFISLQDELYRTLKSGTLLISSEVLKVLILLTVWLVSPAVTFSQKQINRESVYVESYGLEQGLGQSMVSSIHQDSFGVLWVVSGDGLHCFDGRSFIPYRIAYNGNYHHSDNMMRKITGTDDSDFMISSSSSLIRFDPLTADYKFIYREMSVYVVLLDALIKHSPLAWTLNKGLCLASADSLISLKITYSNGAKPPDGFIPIEALWYDKNTLLIMGEEGIIHLSIANNSHNNSHQVDVAFKAFWEKAPGCTGMKFNEKGELLIFRDNSLYKFRGKGSWTPYYNPGISVGAAFCIDYMGNCWFTDKSGQNLYKLKNGKISEINLFENSGKFLDSINTTIRCIFEDKSNNLWFGTDGLGLLKYNPGKVIFSKVLTGFTRCLVSSERYVYAGTYNNGLWRMVEDLSEAQRLNPLVFDDQQYILDVTIDNRDRLWAVTRTALFVLTPGGEVICSFPGNCSSANFIISSNDTIELLRDSELLTCITGPTPRIALKGNHYKLRSYITAFNKCWIATGSGLFLSTSNLREVKGKLPPGSFLSGSDIFDLSIINNEIYASTGNGIEVFSADGERVNPSKGVAVLKNEAIYSVLLDKEERIWFMGLRGLGFITAERDRVIRFGLENNLQSLEFNNNASSTTKNGMLIFGGINGINAINPSKIKPLNKSPEIVRIFTLKVSDTSYSAGILPHIETINLSRKHPNIEGSVIATGYGETGNSGFSFFLEGFETKWSEPSPDAVFSYRNLLPGEYKLFVKYTDVLKREDPPQLLLNINIDRAYWQTPWFYSAVILIIIVTTVLIVKRMQRIRYGNLIKELEREKAIERERTRISKDMHDEVGASLTRISILTELAKKQQSQSPKSVELINTISVIASDVVDELSEIIWAMNPKNDNLESFAAHLRRYAGTYLESTGISIKFDFPETIPSIPMTAELRRNLFLIVKEALHNTVKHANANNVLLRIVFINQTLSITVKDNGTGDTHINIPDEYSSVNISNGNGHPVYALPDKCNGIYNMRCRAFELGGNFKIDSSIVSGTEIAISVSLAEVSNSH